MATGHEKWIEVESFQWAVDSDQSELGTPITYSYRVDNSYNEPDAGTHVLYQDVLLPAVQHYDQFYDLG